MNQVALNQLETSLRGKMSKIIVANWKMNGSLGFIDTYFQNLLWCEKHTVVFCPPFPYLAKVDSLLTKENYFLGAQNCHTHDSGAFTGEVSSKMLADMGCQYVIIGHSERRHQQGETNETVHQKNQQVLQSNMVPIICVGETLEDRQANQHLHVVREQLTESLPSSGNVIIAYEPVWAIGTGLTATLADICEMHQMIAEQCQFQHKILYGGSVTAENVADILAQPFVEGVLVGGASLKPEVFSQIIAAKCG